MLQVWEGGLEGPGLGDRDGEDVQTDSIAWEERWEGADKGVGGEQMSESRGRSKRCGEEKASGTSLSASKAKGHEGPSTLSPHCSGAWSLGYMVARLHGSRLKNRVP